MTQESQLVIYEKKDRIAYLTINRPERMNALGTEVRNGLVESLWDFRNDSKMRILILTGAGDRAFSAGADLKEGTERAKAGQPDVRPLPGTSPWELLLTMYNKPTIAAVNGYALAGGCELSLCCDIRIGTPNARIGIPEARVGREGGFGTILLPRYIPMGIALQQFFTGEPLSAQEAERWGLFNKVVPQEELLPYCSQLAEQILLCAPLSVAKQKHNAYKSWTEPVPWAVQLFQNQGPDLSGKEAEADRIEGAKAFVEKRRPVWTGTV